MKKTVLIILSVFLPRMASTASAQGMVDKLDGLVFYKDSIYYQINNVNGYSSEIYAVGRNIVTDFMAAHPEKVDFPAFDKGFCKGPLEVPNSVEFDGQMRRVAVILLEDLKNPSVKINGGVISSMRRGKFSKLELSPQVLSINEGAFEGCRNLSRFEISRFLKWSMGFLLNSSIQQFVVDKKNNKLKDVDGVLFTRSGLSILKFPMAKCEEYVVPEGTMFLSDKAFSCESDPAGDMSRLKKLVLSESLVGLGDEVFKNNRTLSEIHAKSEMPPVWVYHLGTHLYKQFDGFDNISKCTLYVPKGCKENYMNNEYWGKFAKIVETDQEPAVPASVSHNYFFNKSSLLASYRPFTYKDSIYYKVDWDNDQAVVIDADVFEQEFYIDEYGLIPAGLPQNPRLSICKGNAVIADSVEFDGVMFPVVNVRSLKSLACNSVKLSDNILSVNAWAFGGGTFKHIDLGKGVRKVGDWAFSNCRNLTEIDIPSQLTDCVKAFYSCSPMKEFRVADDNPEYCSIDGVFFSKDRKTLLKFPLARTESYAPPAETEIIDHYAFYTTDSNVALKSLTLGENVKMIKGNVFKANGLTEIRCLSSVPPYAYDTAFRDFSTIDQCTLLVPIGSKEAYATDKNWRLFKNIREVETDGISPIAADEHPSPTYDLQGRKLSNSKWSNGQIRKGIYIKDGRKFVVK